MNFSIIFIWLFSCIMLIFIFFILPEPFRMPGTVFCHRWVRELQRELKGINLELRIRWSSSRITRVTGKWKIDWNRLKKITKHRGFILQVRKVTPPTILDEDAASSLARLARRLFPLRKGIVWYVCYCKYQVWYCMDSAEARAKGFQLARERAGTYIIEWRSHPTWEEAIASPSPDLQRGDCLPYPTEWLSNNEPHLPFPDDTFNFPDPMSPLPIFQIFRMTGHLPVWIFTFRWTQRWRGGIWNFLKLVLQHTDG